VTASVDNAICESEHNQQLVEFCQAVAEDLDMLGQHVIDFLHSALASITDSAAPETLDDLAADYASIYLNHAIQASPEESVWLDEDSLACQRSMFQVRGWYSRYGLSVTDWRKRPDDHLVLELQFIAHLLRAVRSESDLGPVAHFMDEHLLRWLLQFAARVGQRCDTRYFAGIALLTGEYCNELRDLIAEITGQARPTAEEIEQRMKPEHEPVKEPVSFMPGMGPAV